ncbi:GIY-YIG nuclease family protein [Thermovibrio sp.]
MKGTYLLLFSIIRPLRFKLKSGRKFSLKPSLYLYAGSAFGSGGLRARVLRHLRKEKRLHWHLDYITTSSSFLPLEVWLVEGKRLECEAARILLNYCEPILGFGCSDCKCPSHLFLIKPERLDSLRDLVSGALGAKILEIKQLERLWSIKSS